MDQKGKERKEQVSAGYEILIVQSGSEERRINRKKSKFLIGGKS